jgi:hypothetical protein
VRRAAVAAATHGISNFSRPLDAPRIRSVGSAWIQDRTYLRIDWSLGTSSMIKVPNAQTELPREFISQIDPKLVELYSRQPSALAARISFLVRQALPQRIFPGRVLKFAFLYAAAERFTQDDAAFRSVSKEHTRRSKLELAGAIHGLQTGYLDDAEAIQRYRRGRRARQQIKASLEALLEQWRVFEGVVQKHCSELPLHVQSRFSNAILREVGEAFQNMGIATVLDEDDLTSEKGGERERSAIAQAYIWWRLKLPPYRGKWNDMHQLAFAWNMSPAGSVRAFRTVVNRICNGSGCAHRFEKSWESALSEKM